MTLQVCVLGIDGSGKSTVTASLPAVLSAELGVRAGAAGEEFLMVDPSEDHLARRFHPDGLPLAARLSKRLKRLGKRVVDRRKLYPAVKLAQMMSQDHAAHRLGERYEAAAVISDGNVFLSATGRAANYLRPASDKDRDAHAGPGPEDLCAVFDYVLDGKPIPEDRQSRLPDLRKARRLYRLMRSLGLRGAWLPDVVVFLDLSPKIALERIAGRGAKVDRHENESDLSQAREMYLRTLEAFARYRGADAVHRIELDGLSPGQAMAAVVDALRPHLSDEAQRAESKDAPLGTTGVELTHRSFWGKVLNYRYLVRYLMGHYFQGAWREPMFILSGLGRLFLKEGYSANVMRVIYDRDHRDYGLLDRVFLGYPLHRAVYDRLHILTQYLQPELERRLQEGREVTVFTAPSGFAYDLFRPLEAIAENDPEAVRRVRIIAADLDPHDRLNDELPTRAEKIGLPLEFFRGDLCDDEMRAQFAAAGPYDIALFVGLSSWLPKPQTVSHICWVREHIREDGLLVTDCFTADAYSLSGRYVGYQAHYYTPQTYGAVMDCCGFDSLDAWQQSGRDEINHVMVFPPRAGGNQ